MRDVGIAVPGGKRANSRSGSAAGLLPAGKNGGAALRGPPRAEPVNRLTRESNELEVQGGDVRIGNHEKPPSPSPLTVARNGRDSNERLSALSIMKQGDAEKQTLGCAVNQTLSSDCGI